MAGASNQGVGGLGLGIYDDLGQVKGPVKVEYLGIVEGQGQVKGLGKAISLGVVKGQGQVKELCMVEDQGDGGQHPP